jgi:hypothetical protein
VVTPIAAQILDPQATSEIGDGTYFSFATRTAPDVTVASRGTDDWRFVIPATTHRSSDVQAKVEMEPTNDETLDHDVPKLSVRTICHPVKRFVRPTHFFPEQFSDVRTDHVSGVGGRSFHSVPPSVLTKTSIPWDALRKLAMHLRSLWHESAVTDPCGGKSKPSGVDHVSPPSTEVRNWGPLVVDSTIAHVIDA